MAFDAGTIIARLDLDDDEFDRKLRADVAKIEAFERGEHEVKLGVDVDEQGMARARESVRRLDRQITEDSRRHGGLLSWLAGSGRGIAGAAGPGLNTGILSRLVTTRTALIAGGAGIGLGALPALAAPLLGGGVGLAGLGAGLLGARMLIGSKQDPGSLYQPAQAALKTLQATFQQAAAPLAGTLRHVFAQIPALMRSITPALRQMFAGAATIIEPVLHGLVDLAHNVLPVLGQAFRAAAPLMRPLIDGLSLLVRGVLVGLVPLLRAAHPAIVAFSGVLGELGRGIGTMLRDFAPAIKASSIILKALGDVLAAIFPIIGKLAGVFARELGPVFAQLASVVERLLPFLRPLGDVLAKLAGAVLRDLVALLRPLADLLVRIAPSITVLAKALGQTFDVLENSGVFGVLAGALERIVPVLARFINDLVKQLAPYLPVIIAAFAAFLDILIQLTALGLTVVINALDWLIRHVPGLVPILAGTYLAFKTWQAITPIVTGVRKAIEWLTAESTISAAKQVANAAVVAAKWVWQSAVAVVQFGIQAAAATAAFIAENAATLGIIAGIALLVGAIIFLATHWKQTWNVIKTVARDVWEFLTHGWGQFLIPQLFLIRKVVEFVRDHWKQAWTDIRNWALDAWHFIHDRIVAPIVNTFTQTLPNAFRSAVRFIGNAWGDIKNVVRAPVAWVVDHVIDGLISAFDWISGKVGGPHIAPVHPFGLSTGGRIPGYGGGDRHLVLLEGGGKILAALATGNVTALVNAIKGMIPGGVGGAVGDLARLLLAIPRTLIGEAVHKLIGIAKAAFGSPFTGHYGAGVAQWRGDVLRALAMEGLPLSLASRVLYQMQTESGGNPNAINLTDSNAAMGDPSRGLLQTIMSTFRAFHWPGTSWNIYDPLANIAAAINYAVHRYGPSLMSGGMGMGSGHGYDTGGWLGWPLNRTGKPEAVLNPAQSAAFLDLAEAARRGGTGGMRDVYLTLPEGTTVAAALREITWMLRTARQQAWTGAMS